MASCFKRHILINMFWIITITTCLLIASISFNISRDTNMVTVISVAVGISSLIVSLIAIVMTLTSSDTINKSSQHLLSISNQIRNDYDILKQSNEHISVKLDTSINDFKEAFSNNGIVTELSKDTDFITKLYDATPLVSKVFIYALYISYKKEVSFEMSDLLDEHEDLYEGFMFSVMSLYKNADIIDFDVHKNTFAITKFSADLEKLVGSVKNRDLEEHSKAILKISTKYLNSNV